MFDLELEWTLAPIYFSPQPFAVIKIKDGGHKVTNKRLNTRMAPTCDWMIKIVKVNKLYLNSLLVSIVNRVSQSGTMKYQCEWKHRCVKQEMVTYVAKGRQPFLFSEVVQRHSGDEKVICWLNSFSQFRRTIRDWSHSSISPLTGIAPTKTFINFFFQSFCKSFFKQFFKKNFEKI